MKTIEEKARAYDEALKWMSDLYPTLEGSMKEDAEHFFPELKESEDERMKRQTLKVLNYYKDEEKSEGRMPTEIDECIAWLEKQGEYAKFCNKIQIGDKVTRNEDGVLVNLSQLARIAKKNENQCEQQHFNDNFPSFDEAQGTIVVEKQGEQKPAEFDDTNAKQMFIKALERVEEQNNKGYKLTDCDKNSWWEDFKAYTSCTIEQKPAWSEEDEKTIRLLIAIVENNHDDDAMFKATEISPTKYLTRNEVVERIKRLRPQPQWKPSDEQIEALRIARDRNDKIGFYLSQLYDDIKKLM